MSEPLIDQIRVLAGQGLRPPEIAKRLNISRQWVYVICAKRGIAYPKRSDEMPAIVGQVRAGLKSGAAGTIAEMLVAADLLRQGYDVYRSITCNSHGYDLIASRDGKLTTFEVRSAWRNDSGKLTLRHKAGSPADVHAYVVVGEPIIYKPSLIVA